LQIVKSAPQSANRRHSFIRDVGVLRITVGFLIVISLPLVFLTGGEDEGWGIVFTHVVPVLVLLIMWALPFDMLMARVFMSEGQGVARGRYRAVLVLDGALFLGLAVFWGPYFLSIVAQ
jgi:hypothetical protein